MKKLLILIIPIICLIGCNKQVQVNTTPIQVEQDLQSEPEIKINEIEITPKSTKISEGQIKYGEEIEQKKITGQYIETNYKDKELGFQELNNIIQRLDKEYTINIPSTLNREMLSYTSKDMNAFNLHQILKKENKKSYKIIEIGYDYMYITLI